MRTTPDQTLTTVHSTQSIDLLHPTFLNSLRTSISYVSLMLTSIATAPLNALAVGILAIPYPALARQTAEPTESTRNLVPTANSNSISIAADSTEIGSVPVKATAAGAVALTLLPNVYNKVTALGEYLAEGAIQYYIKSPTGGGQTYFSFIVEEDSKEGIEDDILHVLPPAIDAYLKNVATIGGKEVEVQRVPPTSEPRTGSSSIYLVVPEGKTFTLLDDVKYISTASISGFDGWEHRVDEHEIIISKGVYEAGEHSLGSNAQVSFEKDLDHPMWKEEDPTDPPTPIDPNIPIVIVDPNTNPTIGPGRPVGENRVNLYDNWHRVDPMPTSSPNNILYIMHLVEGISNTEIPRAAAIELKQGGFSNLPYSSFSGVDVDPSIYLIRTGAKNKIEGRPISTDLEFKVEATFETGSGSNTVFVQPGLKHQIAFAYPVSTLVVHDSCTCG